MSLRSVRLSLRRRLPLTLTGPPILAGALHGRGDGPTDVGASDTVPTTGATYEEGCQKLVGWIALRVGRAQALAGDTEPLERLEHVVRHWLSEGERSALLAWVTRRPALGECLVPPLPRRRWNTEPYQDPPGDTASAVSGSALARRDISICRQIAERLKVSGAA